MNVLVVCAHHDDLEIGCGGTVAQLLDAGHRVISLVMTHSGYQAPDGTLVRSREAALQEGRRAAQRLGYELLLNCEEDTFDIAENDANVCRILTVIQQHAIDTMLTHWHGDTHPPHQKVHRMAVHASRNVRRVLGFAANWYLGEASFDPRIFVPLTDLQWQRKIEALRCYEGEFRRTGERWLRYLDHRTQSLGVQIGTGRAEAFVIYKYVWEIAGDGLAAATDGKTTARG